MVRPSNADLVRIAICNSFWAPLNLFSQTATSHGFSPGALAAVRWTVVAACLLAFVRFRDLAMPKGRDAAIVLGVGALFFGPAHFLFYRSLQLTTPVEGVVLGTSAPIWTSLLAWIFLREKIGRAGWLALALGATGAYIVSVGFRAPSLDSKNAVGNVLYLTAVLFEAIVGIVVAPIVRRTSGIGVLSLQTLGAGTALMVAVPLIAPFNVAGDAAGWGAAGYMIVFGGLVNFGLWYGLVERNDLSFLAISLLVQPPLAALVSWLVRGETPTAQTAIGTLCILVALAISVAASRPRRTAAPTPPATSRT